MLHRACRKVTFLGFGCIRIYCCGVCDCVFSCSARDTFSVTAWEMRFLLPWQPLMPRRRSIPNFQLSCCLFLSLWWAVLPKIDLSRVFSLCLWGSPYASTVPGCWGENVCWPSWLLITRVGDALSLHLCYVQWSFSYCFFFFCKILQESILIRTIIMEHLKAESTWWVQYALWCGLYCWEAGCVFVTDSLLKSVEYNAGKRLTVLATIVHEYISIGEWLWPGSLCTPYIYTHYMRGFRYYLCLMFYISSSGLFIINTIYYKCFGDLESCNTCFKILF